jgi:hypothetical protein
LSIVSEPPLLRRDSPPKRDFRAHSYGRPAASIPLRGRRTGAFVVVASVVFGSHVHGNQSPLRIISGSNTDISIGVYPSFF